MNIKIEQHIDLSNLTSIHLGGKARYFVSCKNEAEIREALHFAIERELPVQVLGEGSNIIFSDAGFDGVVIKVDIFGWTVKTEGNYVIITVGAGVNFDSLVNFCVDNQFSGLECLSGIPGSVGATPIQNVGAYGYEISDNLLSLRAIDKNTLKVIEISKAECDFSYRNSRFKTRDKDRFVITQVTYGLRKDKLGTAKYKELANFLKARNMGLSLKEIRTAVLSLRKSKSMIVDPDDINSRSVGSFFVNPTLNLQEFDAFVEHCNHLGINHNELVFYPANSKFKIPAAWLIERAGFAKGFRKGGVGISDRHALALININGTTEQLLELADEIERKVHKNFGVRLEREAIIVR